MVHRMKEPAARVRPEKSPFLRLFAPAALAGLLLGPAVGSAVDPAPRTIDCTLQQCFDRAMKRSPLIAAARTDINKYAALVREADSTRMPKIQATGFASVLPTLKDGRTGSDVFSDWDWSRTGPFLTGQLSFSQALYTFGKISTLRHMASIGVRVGRAVQQVAKMEMHYQLARAWWTLVLADELGDIIKDGEKHLKKERDRLDAAQDDDDFDPNSLLQVRMLEADFEARVRMAKRTRALAEDGLRMALAEPPTTRIRATSDGLRPIQFAVLPTAAYEMIALANHPRLLAQRGGLAVKLDRVRYARDELWPDILLVGRAAYTYAPTRESSTSVTENPTNPTVSGGGIALRWSLDFWRQSARIDQAEIAHLQASKLVRAEEQKVRLDVRRIYRELVDAQAMVNVHERAMRAARGWLRTEEEMQGGGFSEYRELARALEQYYRRKLTWLESIHTYNVLVAELSRAVGSDITLAKAPPSIATAPKKQPKIPDTP